MRQSKKLFRSGFTLTELAIVLSIIGVVVGGLWRLSSSGNQQLRDQSAASQHQQLISAVKSYLASTQGQGWMAGNNATTTAFNLPLPTVNIPGTCTIAVANNQFCVYLPSGFINTTTNAYRQTYTINVVGDGKGTVPTTYSFMIMASGAVIPDTDGGSISSGIGSDGGFIYTNPVCDAQITAGVTNVDACGAYGAWAVKVNPTYGFGAAAGYSGSIASRTYITPYQDSGLPWLERNIQIQPDPTFSYNTMSTDLFMGQKAGVPTNIWMAPAGIAVGGNINMAANGAINGGGTINLQGGKIVLQSGSLEDHPQTAGDTQLSGFLSFANASGQPYTNGRGGSALNANIPFIRVSTGCTQDAAAVIAGLVFNANCQVGIQANSDVNVAGELSANDLYAQTFNYSSDMRLKKNIMPVMDGLQNVMELKPVSFTFKSSGQKGLGFIAQDIEKIYPELVSTDNQGKLAVNYDGLIAPLVASVQELEKENHELREEIQAQEIRQKKLEKELHSTSQ